MVIFIVLHDAEQLVLCTVFLFQDSIDQNHRHKVSCLKEGLRHGILGGVEELNLEGEIIISVMV